MLRSGLPSQGNYSGNSEMQWSACRPADCPSPAVLIAQLARPGKRNGAAAVVSFSIPLARKFSGEIEQAGRYGDDVGKFGGQRLCDGEAQMR